ncbi:MAG: M3 family oligoendopeptidase [Bacteroidetes bacterium]|nr:M3 family oligoendopeptidase [Bacteroidota bacterium]
MNLKFSEFEYKRPDIESIKKDFNELIEEFNKAQSAQDQYLVLKKITELRKDYDSMNRIASIRYTIDTSDKFYEEEHDYFDDIGPVYSGLIKEMYSALVNSKFREDLEKIVGEHLFNVAEVSIKTFKPEIIEDLKKENHLSSKYVRLIASAKIMFEGEERNLAGMDPFMNSDDREIRKKAYDAKWKFFEENEKKIDEIYDDLVKVRTKIAHALGYDNFIQLGYDRLRRTGYTDNEVAGFRDEIRKYLVPLTQELKELQKKRTGYDKLHYYDSEYNFRNGNPKPKGSPDWIVEKARIMYDELSPETSEFFNFMIDHEVMDLYNRKNKSAGGYCSFIQKYKSPYIFANMNGTDHDVKVLTHEAGHAFQAFESRKFEFPEYQHPTLEACEIHSMSMEFITWPWMGLFFEEDTDKFLLSHLNRALMFIPYGVSVDEFQHFVYGNPDATPDERKSKWREIEKKYMPHKDYDGNDFLSRGGYWFMQGHIFKMPFYYIDYCLAEICALQFWRKCNHDRDVAWKDYLALCREGGSKPFLELIKVAKIDSPFESSVVESIIGYVDEFLENVSEEYDLV